MGKNGFHIRIQQAKSELNIEKNFLGIFFEGQCNALGCLVKHAFIHTGYTTP